MGRQRISCGQEAYVALPFAVLPAHRLTYHAVFAAISPEAANVYWQNRLGIGEDNKKFNFDVEGFSSLLRSMLKMDPEARPTAEEVLRHPFLAVDDSDVSK